MMKITIVAGARPNFIKIAPIVHELERVRTNGTIVHYRLVHTGQHYDQKMSASFFHELNIPEPDVNLECGGGSQAEQTAAILKAFEKELLNNPPDVVLVVGDVNSTMACAIVAKKLQIKVAHVEAGIRSFDLTMPEEINRLVTDSITDYYFTTSEYANENLRRAGIKDSSIFFVGNVMIDTLLKQLPYFKKPSFFDKFKLFEKKYFVLTLHRPSNVDDITKLKLVINEILNSTRGFPIVFPVHPRTARILQNIDINSERLLTIDPLGYLEFNYLVKNSTAVITDSGGITEETTVLNVPCLTLRSNTERPETVEMGSNILVGTDPASIRAVLNELFTKPWKESKVPPLWDGKTAERIVNGLLVTNG